MSWSIDSMLRKEHQVDQKKNWPKAQISHLNSSVPKVLQSQYMNLTTGFKVACSACSLRPLEYSVLKDCVISSCISNTGDAWWVSIASDAASHLVNHCLLHAPEQTHESWFKSTSCKRGALVLKPRTTYRYEELPSLLLSSSWVNTLSSVCCLTDEKERHVRNKANPGEDEAQTAQKHTEIP